MAYLENTEYKYIMSKNKSSYNIIDPLTVLMESDYTLTQEAQ